MNRDIFIRNLTKEKIVMSPKGRSANELTPEEFENCHPLFEEALQNIDMIDWMIEELENSTLEKQIVFLNTYKGVIAHVKGRIAEINLDRS